ELLLHWLSLERLLTRQCDAPERRVLKLSLLLEGDDGISDGRIVGIKHRCGEGGDKGASGRRRPGPREDDGQWNRRGGRWSINLMRLPAIGVGDAEVELGAGVGAAIDAGRRRGALAAGRKH